MAVIESEGLSLRATRNRDTGRARPAKVELGKKAGQKINEACNYEKIGSRGGDWETT